MSEDWKAGDIAVCVDARPCTHCGEPAQVSVGRAYRVEGTHPFGGKLYLHLFGVGSTRLHVRGENSVRFRKLNDGDGDAEALERILKCRSTPARIGNHHA